MFRTVLPTEYSSGNVIFTISNNEPPRTQTSTLQLPYASTIRVRESGISDQERRLTVGDLIFTVTTGLQQNPGSNKKAFEVGQFLEFGDQTSPSGEILNVPVDIVIQHNTNLLDLESSGLNNDQISDLLEQSVNKFNELKKSLAVLQSEASNISVKIVENQKSINEQNKIINVAKIITGTNSVIYIELTAKLALLQQEQSNLLAYQMTNKTETENVYNQLLTISVVVK